MASTIQGRFSTKIGRSNTVQSTNNFNDIYNNKTKTLFVCQTEEEVLKILSEVKNLKKFKGEIKIIKVVL